MAFQKNLAAKLMDCSRALSDATVKIKRLRKRINEEDNDGEKNELISRLEQIENTKFANQNISRIIKIIIDGIAWRNLDYNRINFRLMAENRPSGRIDINDSGFIGMMNLADSLMRGRKSIVIINDLTNFIRIGDLTEKYKKNVFIHEVKRKGKRVINIFTILKDREMNRGISKQSNRLLKVQTALTHKKIFLENGGIVKIRNISFKFNNHLRRVRGIIKKAKKLGFYQEVIADYLVVSCMDIVKAVKIAHKSDCSVGDIYKFEDIWNELDFVLPFQNLDFFYRNEEYFIPNMTPYSVFPFPSKICLELMNGRLLLNASLNITELCKIFRCNGWEVELIDIESFISKNRRITSDFPNISKMFEYDETICIIKRGGFNLGIPATWIFRVGMDFMAAETLLEEVEAIFNLAIQGKDEWSAINNPREKRIWN